MSKRTTRLRAISPLEMSERINRSDLIFRPEVQAPSYALALFQHMVRGGGLYGDDDLNEIVAPHFGDGFQWAHFQEVWGMFRFGRGPRMAVDVFFSAIVSFLFVLRAILGTDGAFRFWCALFEQAHSGVRVRFDTKREAVAILERTAPDAAPGWDAWYPDYQLYTLRVLESSRDQEGVLSYMTYAASTGADAFVRTAADGFLRLAHELPNGRSRGQLEAFGDVTDSLALRVLRKNVGLADASAAEQPPATVSAYGSMFGHRVKPGVARQWADAQIQVRRSYGSPNYPITGYDYNQLAGLTDNQRYGARRDLDGDGAADMTHMGLDLPAPQGTEVVALYDGTVKWSRGDWKKGGDAKGNHVLLEHTIRIDGATRSLMTEYYHLSSVAVEPGDTVRAGQKIGEIGSTGNSTGPHLHLVVREALRDDLGRSAYRTTLDPEVVLRDGLAGALAAAGSPVASHKPHLALGSTVLRGAAMAKGSHLLPATVARFDAAAAEAAANPAVGMSKEHAVALLKANHAAGSPWDPTAYGGWFEDAMGYAAAGLDAGIKLVLGDEVGGQVAKTLNDIASSEWMQTTISWLTQGEGARWLSDAWNRAGLPGEAIRPLLGWMGDEYQRQLALAQGNREVAKAATIRSAQARLDADQTLDADATAKAVQAVTQTLQRIT